MKRIIYDGDPGIDDALAILLALRSPEVKLEAITTVGGNVSLELATQNALRILEFIGNDVVRVAKGYERPGLGTATDFHGEDGLGNTGLPPPTRTAEKKNAVDLMASEIRRERHEISLVTAGPLTNLAKAVEKDPCIKDYVREVIVMGGAIEVPGNVTPAAEFNIYADPEAAQTVFASGLPITLVPLDVTTQVILTPEHLAKMEEADTELTDFMGRMVRYYMKASRMFEGLDGCYLHDPLAVGFAIDNSIAHTEMIHVKVETREGSMTRGMTMADLRAKPASRPNIRYCSKVRSEDFLNLFINRLRSWS
ncbi:MAG: nucleoside hydrolase [Candidatus Bathyarchaeota archaeon]|nr:nucleoside hydrolase [Candidatus Bathyarchaeota archaeon]